jgi:hypothetical protein
VQATNVGPRKSPLTKRGLTAVLLVAQVVTCSFTPWVGRLQKRANTADDFRSGRQFCSRCPFAVPASRIRSELNLLR